MKASDQGTQGEKWQRYQAIPRTLTFVTSISPVSGLQEVLLLKGAPTKRLWANKFNGLGGHVEAHESVYEAAVREVQEEAGLTLADIVLRGVVNIDTGPAQLGVMMFVFCTAATTREIHHSAEGRPQWIPVTALADYPLVDDLYRLIPLALGDGPPFFGHYSPRPNGEMHYRFG